MRAAPLPIFLGIKPKLPNCCGGPVWISPCPSPSIGHSLGSSQLSVPCSGRSLSSKPLHMLFLRPGIPFHHSSTLTSPLFFTRTTHHIFKGISHGPLEFSILQDKQFALLLLHCVLARTFIHFFQSYYLSL